MEQIAYLLGLTVLLFTTVAALCAITEIYFQLKGISKNRTISLIKTIGKFVVIINAFIAIPTFFIANNLSSKSSEEIVKLNQQLIVATKERDRILEESKVIKDELDFLKNDRVLTVEQKKIISNTLKQVNGRITIESIVGREPQAFADDLFSEFSKTWDAKRLKFKVVPNSKTIGITLRVHSKETAPLFTKTAYLALKAANLNPVLTVHESNKEGELVLLVGEKISRELQENIFPGSTVNK